MLCGRGILTVVNCLCLDFGPQTKTAGSRGSWEFWNLDPLSPFKFTWWNAKLTKHAFPWSPSSCYHLEFILPILSLIHSMKWRYCLKGWSQWRHRTQKISLYIYIRHKSAKVTKLPLLVLHRSRLEYWMKLSFWVGFFFFLSFYNLLRASEAIKCFSFPVKSEFRTILKIHKLICLLNCDFEIQISYQRLSFVYTSAQNEPHFILTAQIDNVIIQQMNL